MVTSYIYNDTLLTVFLQVDIHRSSLQKIPVSLQFNFFVKFGQLFDVIRVDHLWTHLKVSVQEVKIKDHDTLSRID